MVEKVVVDKLAIEPPLALEERRRRLVEYISSCSLNLDRLIHIIVGLDPERYPVGAFGGGAHEGVTLNSEPFH